MPDRLAALLNAEADRRVAGEAVPPVSSVRVRRVPSRRPSVLRTAGPMLAAAAAVIVVALIAGQLRSPAPPAATTAAPSAPSSPTPSAVEPELGTMPTPQEVRSFHQGMVRPPNSSGQQKQIPLPDRVDVLARATVEPGVTVYLVGYHGDGLVCVVQLVVDTTVQQPPGGGAGGCGPTGPDGRQLRIPGGPALGLDRSFVAGSGRPAEQLLSTELPAGSERLRLSAAGVDPKTVPAYDAGSRWGHAAFVLTAWPSKLETRGEALASDDSVIATSDDEGLDERDVDPKVLEAQARCLERAGIKVDRLPGGGYSWNVEGREDLQRSCLAEARRTVPSTG